MQGATIRRGRFDDFRLKPCARSGISKQNALYRIRLSSEFVSDLPTGCGGLAEERTLSMSRFDSLMQDIIACDHCRSHLPHGPRPVVQASPRAKLLIIGQAPGRRVHASGVPWDDPSGERLRRWLGIDAATFYDAERVALVPMGFCYPGTGKSGDLPPRPECAPRWHAALLESMPDVRLTLLLSQYALNYYLEGRRHKTLTATVKAWRDYRPDILPLPHPSPRNNIWLRKNPWFEDDVLPYLRQRVAALDE